MPRQTKVVYLLVLTNTKDHTRSETQEVVSSRVKAATKASELVKSWQALDPDLEISGSIRSGRVHAVVNGETYNLAISRVDDQLSVEKLTRFWRWRNGEET